MQKKSPTSGRIRVSKSKSKPKEGLFMDIINTISLECNRRLKINFDGGDLSSDVGCLLLQEFIGDAYKTSRKILLKNLDGKVFNEIRFYKPENCENPYLIEYASRKRKSTSWARRYPLVSKGTVLIDNFFIACYT